MKSPRSFEVIENDSIFIWKWRSKEKIDTDEDFIEFTRKYKHTRKNISSSI